MEHIGVVQYTMRAEMLVCMKMGLSEHIHMIICYPKFDGL